MRDPRQLQLFSLDDEAPEWDLIAAYCRAHYTYDPESGLVHNRKTGKSIGRIHHQGYITILIPALRCTHHNIELHRIAYLLQVGTWPPAEIDHRNGHRSDNAWTNLRPATRAQNAANAKQRDSKTGIRGVYPARNGRFVAIIGVAYAKRYLGTFKTAEAATAARQLAEDFYQRDYAFRKRPKP